MALCHSFLWLSNIPLYTCIACLGFPGSSAGKEFACSTRDPGSVSGLGRSPGEGIGYPLQYSWASLVAQLVKNLPVVQETLVWSLRWEWSPGEGKGYPLQYSGLENSMDCIVLRVVNSWTQLSDFHFHFFYPFLCCRTFMLLHRLGC